MDDIPRIGAHGCLFEVTAKGFDDKMGSLAKGLIEMDRILTALGPQKVRTIHAAGIAADNDIDGMGTTKELIAIEQAGLKAAGFPKDCILWIRAINK